MALSGFAKCAALQASMHLATLDGWLAVCDQQDIGGIDLLAQLRPIRARPLAGQGASENFDRCGVHEISPASISEFDDDMFQQLLCGRSAPKFGRVIERENGECLEATPEVPNSMPSQAE